MNHVVGTKILVVNVAAKTSRCQTRWGWSPLADASYRPCATQSEVLGVCIK